MKKRTVATLAAVLFAFSGLAGRLYVLSRDRSAAAVEGQSTVTVTVERTRGTVYDAHLNRLTGTKTHYAAAVVATPKVLAALSESVTPAQWQQIRSQLTDGKPTVLYADSPFPLAEGIRQYTVTERGGTAIAAHILGYLDDTGEHGACGVEAACDSALSDAGGVLTVTYHTDGAGRVQPSAEVEVNDTRNRSRAGVALTVDSAVQSIVETEVGGRISKGAAVVLEVGTGRILAMASFPGYRTDAVAEYLEAENSPLFNRAVAAYNCGSVFKIAVAMAALENGVPLSRQYTCTGAASVGAIRVGCHYKLGHGPLDLRGGLSQSCNPYFIQLALSLGGSPIYRTASLLGFDSPWIPLAEYRTARAVLPSEDELNHDEALANVAIGQGGLLATPLHVAAMTACVAGGGDLYRPTLLLGTVDAGGTLTECDIEPPTHVCSAATAATLRDLLCDVVENGTGKSACPTVGGAGGKTGTAETGWKVDGKTMVHSWFTGFYPAESPHYVITVLAEDSGTTGEIAAPAFKAVCDRLARLKR